MSRAVRNNQREFQIPKQLTISASPDDAADPRRSAAGRGDSDRRRPPRSGGGSSIAINLMLVVLLAGVMATGWFVANQQRMLKAAEAARADAEARLLVLEDRLRVTDEVLTESGADTEDKISFWESEIRKLWAISNERNRGWIEDNQKLLKQQAAALKELASGQQQLGASIAQQAEALTATSGVAEDLKLVEQRIGTLLETQRDLVDKVNKSRQTVASLQSGLANRVAENEQAVQSMDAFRVQINGRLLELERRLSGG